MPRPLTPYPDDQPYAVVLTPLLAELDDADAFTNVNDPALWTLPLIRALNAERISAVHAGIAQLFIFNELGVGTTPDHWAILNATRAFGAVDSSTLTLICLRRLLQAAAILWQAVMTMRVRDAGALAALVTTRKLAISSQCPGLDVATGLFLNRAADQLTPFIRR